MAKKIDTQTIVTIGAVGLGIYILYKPIKALFDTFGITQSATSQAVTTLQTSGTKSPFSPLYWRTVRGAHLLPLAQANAKAQAIFESITYTGKFLNGNQFQTGTFDSSLSGLITGWQIVVPYIGKGGHMIILLPSSLAYGTQGSSSIPPNTPLYFDIVLN